MNLDQASIDNKESEKNKVEREHSQQSKDHVLNPEERQRLTSKLLELKQALNNLHAERQKWRSEKQALTKKKQELITSLKRYKDQRKSLNSEISKLKQDKEQVLARLAKLCEEKKSLVLELKKQSKLLGLKKDLNSIEREITDLEFMIETSAMSYEREKKILKRIKELKNILKKSACLKSINDKINTLNESIKNLSQELESFNSKIRELVTRKHDLRENIISINQALDDLTKQEVLANAKVLGLNKQISEYNEQIKQVLNKLSRFVTKKQQGKKLTLEQVEDKLLKGGKLTTEDLLLLQKTLGRDN